MKKIIFAVSIFAALVMSGCRPETRNQMLGIPDDAILLSTESFSDVNAKTSVSGTSVQWVGGDKIDFYVGTGDKQTREVVVSEGNAYVASALTGDGVIRGYYPAGITDGNETTDGVIVKIPAEYTCSVSGGRQVIALPMVGRADAGATTIKFKHLTAAVNVALKNSLGSDLYVDKVVLTSENYQICTPSGVTIDLGNENLGNLTSTTTGNRSVTVKFSGDDFLVANGTSDKSIQVPIRPIGADNLTIEVYCHSATKSYHYSYRPDAAVSALGRNVLLTAMVDLKLTGNGGHMTEVEDVGRKIDLSTVGYSFTAEDGDTLYGTPQMASNKYCVVSIEDGAKITLNGVTASGKSLSIRALGDATINLLGTNTITGGSNYAGIHGKSGKTLTIQGEGTLYDSVFAYGAAAIGSYATTGGQCGDIVIKGGNITAIATNSAAAIGCGSGYACGDITIEGGSIIAKTTVSNAAAIGTSQNASASCGDITIKNTVTSVTATKGSGAKESIGRGNASSTCGTVTIETGANVTQN